MDWAAETGRGVDITLLWDGGAYEKGLVAAPHLLRAVIRSGSNPHRGERTGTVESVGDVVANAVAADFLL
jgi:hypothetical protein